MEDKKIVKPGIWYILFDDKGNLKEAHYDESYYNLLGYKSQEEYVKLNKKWESSIHPDDQERINKLYAEYASSSTKLDYDVEYRMLTRDGYRWFHDYGHCTRREDGTLTRCDGIIFDIQEIIDRKIAFDHEQLKIELLDYFNSHEDQDPVELLKEYAEKIRVLLNCDQVIYRDLEETRIMVNSDGIANTWSVPIEYCRQCEHFNAHHPMYKDGYTLMNDCQKGWQGIPVFHKCPIKSSLTRLVYCDGEIAGYLAVHYVQQYHTFTKIEENTLEVFARLMSLSLSRFSAKQRSTELSSLKKSMDIVFSLSEFDPIIVIDPETGEYDWLMSVADDVINNTSMTLHGENLYKNIGIDGASIIHPEDREQFKAFYSPENIKKIAKTGEIQEIENRWFIQTEGMYRWKYNKAVRMISENKKVFVVVGVIDTTEKKLKEIELEEQKKNAELSKYFFLLQDNFESLYDINLETEKYVSYDRGAFYKQNIRSKLVSETEFFKDLKTNIERVIYKDDRDSLYEFQKKENIVKALSKQDHVDHYYRIITDNGPVWLKMRITYKDESKKNVILGVYNAEQEMAEKEKDELIKEQLIENNARMFALEDNLESFYDVELATGFYSVFVKGQFYKDNVLEKLSSSSSSAYGGDYFKELKDNIESVIYPDDKEGLFNALKKENIVKELSQNDHFDYLYRLVANNKPVWFRVRVVYKNDEKKNVIIGAFNAEKDVEAKQLQEQNKKINEALIFTNFFLDTYISAYYVNLKDLTCTVYKRTSQLEKDYPIVDDYFKSINDYIDRDVHPDDREKLKQLIKPGNMYEYLSKEPQISHIFRDISGGKEKTYRMQVIRGASFEQAAFGFIDITKEVKEQNKRVAEQEEVKNLIESISASYNVVYAVNLSDDSFTLIRMDENILGSHEKFDTFTEAKEFFFSIIPEMDKKKMRHELDYDVIRKRLKKEKSFNVEYRVPIKGAMLWHQMNVTQIDNNRVAICFAQRDIELTKKHLEEKRYREYFALYEIDIDSGMLKIVKDSPWYGIDRAGTAMPYTPAMLKFAESLDGEARDYFTQMADLEYVKKQYAKEDKHTYAYRSNNVGNKNWVDSTSYVTLRHEDGTPAMFSIGFSMVDSLGVFRQELQVKYKQALDVVTEEKMRNDVLHDIIHSGKWSFKVSKDDAILSAEYSKEAMQVINNDFSSGAKNWTDLLHPDDKEATLEAFMAAVKDHSCKTPYDVTYRMVDRNGEYHWFHSAGRVVRDENGEGEFFGIHIDISSQIEEQLKQHKELEAAREAADAANKSKSNFLFNMSHDIRTPMNAIRGFTSMAKKHIDDKDKVSEYLNKIDISGDQLLRLINQVLEMARIESGKIEFEERPIEVKAEFNSMITILSEQAKSSGLQFEYDLVNIKHNNLLCDESRVSSITLNIVGNAMKYTPEGGKILYRLEEIEPRKPGRATFMFTVSDTGIGMSEEYQKIIYEPFSRENSTTVSKIQGTGLGLSIVKNLVDLMGGEIKVESHLGKGTRFDIVLDFKIDRESKDKEKEKININVKSFKGKRILLVEDNEMNREIATDILEEYGFVIETANDGDVAVEMVKKHFDKEQYKYFDYILMDIQMPKMSGYEATKAIRALPVPEGIHVPVIAMTANAFEEDRKDALEAGMDEHCSKPINIQALLATLSKF